MTEYERKREEIAELIYEPGSVYDIADQILAIDGIEIRADDQSLPNNPHSPMVDRKFGTFGEGQDSMLKAGFIKVIPKGR